MSAYSQNTFALLSEDRDVFAPPPIEKEEPVAKKEKHDSKTNIPHNKRGNRPPRRPFDRHSATGLVDSKKKINQGWGHAETAQVEAANDVLNPNDPDAPEKQVVASEPKENLKTLDEYLAEQANKSLKVTLPEIRKANDNDNTAFKDAVAFTKLEPQDFFVGKNVKSSAKKSDKARKEKVLVNIEQRFDARDSFRGRRGNSGHHGPRRNNRTSSNNKPPAVNIQDANAFPSLGA